MNHSESSAKYLSQVHNKSDWSRINLFAMVFAFSGLIVCGFAFSELICFEFILPGLLFITLGVIMGKMVECFSVSDLESLYISEDIELVNSFKARVQEQGFAPKAQFIAMKLMTIKQAIVKTKNDWGLK